MENNILYFDASATVPMKPEVIEEIYTKMKTTWGNPSSEHIMGLKAKEELEKARQEVADYMGCESSEIIFTPSASASNNLAIRGLCKTGKILHILTLPSEHKSVIASCEEMETDVDIFSYKYVKLTSEGKVDLSDLEIQIQKLTAQYKHDYQFLVSIALASSELGVIQDLRAIYNIVHNNNGILHVDATQCFSRFPIDLSYVDMLTAGGSKIGAGKGIGVLYKKKHIPLHGLILGGMQEHGYIAGTEDVPKICGFAKALYAEPYQSLIKYRDYLLEQLSKTGLKYIVIGDMEHHLDNHLCIGFKHRKADAIVAGCSSLGLCISAGSACNSGTTKLSPALKALNLSSEYTEGAIRISLPQNVSYEDIDKSIKILSMVVDNANEK